MQRAIRVPQRPAAIGRAAGGHGVDLPVEPGIAPVDIGEERRRELRMIQRGRQDRALVGAATGDAHRIERLRPLCAGCVDDGVEIPVPGLAGQVRPRAGDVHARNRAAQHDRCGAGIVPVQHHLQALARDLPRALGLRDIAIAEGTDAVGPARGLQREVDAPPLRPPEHPAPAGDRAVAVDRQAGLVDQRRGAGRVADEVRQVEQDMPCPLGEGIAVPAGALGHRQLGPHARFERDTVEARLRPLVRKALAIARVGVGQRPRLEQHRPRPRHHHNVEHVADPGARQMGMAEPHDRAVAMVITRAGRPPLDIGIGAELDHAERQRRAGIGMPVAARADQQIGCIA